MRRFSKIHLLFCLCIIPAISWGDTKVHKWADYSEPFKTRLQGIDEKNPRIVEVYLPQSVIGDKEVTLIFTSVASGTPTSRVVLSVNDKELPLLPTGYDVRVVLTKGDIKPGINRLSFLSWVGNSRIDISDLRIEVKEPVAKIPKKSDQSGKEQVYKWSDYTQPFKTRVQVGAEKPGIVLVELPESLKEYNDIPLRVSSIGGLQASTTLEINGTRVTSFTAGPGAKILIPKEAIRAGTNFLRFDTSNMASFAGRIDNSVVEVYEIGFDLPASKTSIAKDSPPDAARPTEKIAPVEAEQAKSQLPASRIDMAVSKREESPQNAGGTPKIPIAKDSSLPPTKPVEASLSSKPELPNNPQSPASAELNTSKREETLQVPKTAPKVEMMPSMTSTDRGQRWAVVIGVSEYEDSRIPSLRYAAQDAKSVYEWLVSPNGGRFSPSRVKLLLDRNATNDNIKDTLFNWLKQAIEEDLVVIYFAGHGSPESPDAIENLYLLPSNTKYSNIAVTGFPMWDIETALKRFIKAKRVVIIADACHSAGVGQAFDMATRTGRGIQVNSIHSGFQGLTYVAEGICVISASRDKEVSREGREWGGGHGVFSHFLLEGLKGAGDLDRNGTVTIGELTVYVSEQVRRATLNAQNPIVSGRFDPALTIAK